MFDSGSEMIETEHWHAQAFPARRVVSAYDEIVHWKKELFTIPNSFVGKSFVNELASQLQVYVDSMGSNTEALLHWGA